MDFGARVPGTNAHKACGDWLVSELKRHGAEVSEQQGTMLNFATLTLPLRNIIAHIPGNSSTNILLCAHWDSRPWCDEDAKPNNRMLPVPGANDGASGVGVLLEIARQLQILRSTDKANQIPTVDIIFFDAEDMGTPNHYTGPQRENTWCLGSQFWAKQYIQTPTEQRTKYQYGILLDMVGDPSATFPREYISTNYAGTYVEMIWRTAAKLGYSRYFVNQPAYPITDDHYYINTIAGIPCVDIIDYKPNNGTGFADWWHTTQDDMRNINLQTLQAVGETVITTICSK
jgi:Zn-dependent M28 family amino/carboxypeptidase